MNVSPLAPRFTTEKPAGSSASRPASKEPAAPLASAVVILSDGNPQPALTYRATSSQATSPSGLQLPPLLLPTRENAARLAAKAGEGIAAKLEAAGIPQKPGFSVEIEDVNSAHVTVKGDRADVKAIEDLINGDRSLQMDIHNAHALASHIPAIERAAKFSQDYQAAQSQAEIEAVVAKYSDLFSGLTPQADIKMLFGNDGLQLSINGESTSVRKA